MKKSFFFYFLKSPIDQVDRKSSNMSKKLTCIILKNLNVPSNISQ